MWKDAVGNKALKGKIGCVTAEDWMDVAMGAMKREKTKAWGMRKH